MYQSPVVDHPFMPDVPCADLPFPDQSCPDPMFPTLSFPDLTVTPSKPRGKQATDRHWFPALLAVWLLLITKPCLFIKVLATDRHHIAGSGLSLSSGISTGDKLLIAAYNAATEAAAARENIWQRTQLSAQDAQARDATEDPPPSKTGRVVRC